MNRVIFFALIFLPSFAHGQLDMSANMYWVGSGNTVNQMYGAGGVNYLGRINDTIPHALAISEFFEYQNQGGANPGERAAYILNRYPGDTARIYEFPGHRVFPAHFNNDKFVDFLCCSSDQRTITILLGTPRIDSFVTAAIVHDQALDYLDNEIIVADLDSSGYDDALILMRQKQSSMLFKGGAVFDTVPRIMPHALAGSQWLSLGKVRDTTHRYVCESRRNLDTVHIVLYALGPAFTFDTATESIVCTIDTSRYSDLSWGFNTIDADGDGIDDIFLSCFDKNWKSTGKENTTILVYKGGATVDPLPAYFFHRPIPDGTSGFGTQMIDVGDVTGHGYHSLLVNDPDGLSGGVIFLYNLGKAREDVCTGYAEGLNSDNDCFGCYLSSLGDLDSDGRAEFATGYRYVLSGQIDAGGVYIFNGDATYGPKVGVDEYISSPNTIGIIQNYPNPFSQHTTISFSLPVNSGKNILLSVHDVLGRRLEIIYDESSDGLPHSVVFDGSSLQTGMYLCRLTCGGTTITKPMIVMK